MSHADRSTAKPLHKKRLEFLDFRMSDRALYSMYVLGSVFSKIKERYWHSFELPSLKFESVDND